MSSSSGIRFPTNNINPGHIHFDQSVSPATAYMYKGGDVTDHINNWTLIQITADSTSPVIISFTNAQHDHLSTVGGGLITTAGKVVQLVDFSTGAVATGSTVIPYDDTIPQNTEGDQYLSVAITPTDVANTLDIETQISLQNNTSGIVLIVAIFRDNVADAITTGFYYGDAAGGHLGTFCLRHEVLAGSTAPTTIKVRAGGSAAGTTTLNGSGGLRRFGGVLHSCIRITEYKP